MVGLIRKIIVIMSIVLLALVIVCSASTENVTISASSKDVKVSGSSTVMPLAEVAAEEFNAKQKDYVVTISAGGTGAGILGIAERKNDIAMASREITDDEKKRFGDSFEEFLVGQDGISLAVSDRIYQAGVKGLSLEQVRDIYSGNITNWKELGGPDADIYVISREEGSGTRDSFNEIVLGRKDAETPGVDTVAFGGAEVKTAIARSDKAIGYLGFNYLGGGADGIAFDGIMPTYENIKLDLYELHRHLYFYTFGKPAGGAQAFIDFVRGPEGQKIAVDEGFIPA